MKQTTDKEVLHTQGEWYINRFDKLVTISSTTEGDGILTVTSGNVKKCEADAELICKAVNERQKLLDSNKELLEQLEKALKCIYTLENQVNDSYGTAWATNFTAPIKTAINNAKHLNK